MFWRSDKVLKAVPRIKSAKWNKETREKGLRRDLQQSDFGFERFPWFEHQKFQLKSWSSRCWEIRLGDKSSIAQIGSQITLERNGWQLQAQIAWKIILGFAKNLGANVEKYDPRLILEFEHFTSERDERFLWERSWYL